MVIRPVQISLTLFNFATLLFNKHLNEHTITVVSEPREAQWANKMLWMKVDWVSTAADMSQE